MMPKVGLMICMICSTIIAVVAATSVSSLAADRTFTKSEAKQVAAALVPALPAAPPGWKIQRTASGMEAARHAGRRVFLPALSRAFLGPSEKRSISLMLIYGYRSELERFARQYLDASGRAKRGVDVRKIGDFTLYVYGDDSMSEYFMRVGSFAVLGHGMDTDKASVIGLLGKIDFDRLMAIQ